MTKKFLAFILVNSMVFCATAQSKLYLDIKIGSEYAYAEGAHYGLGNYPLKGRKFILKFFPSATLRYQLNDKLSLSTGYSGGAAGYGYKLKIPDNITHNDFGGAWNSSASAIYIDRIPFLLDYKFHQFNFIPIDDSNSLYNYSIKIGLSAGVGLSKLHGFTNNRLTLGPVFLKDTIEFKESDPQVINRWGGYATLGATARFYRLGKERLNVSLFVNQGFTDLLHTQLDYTYNSRKGSQLFRSRGSGIGFTVGIPILLKTIEPKATTTQ